MEDIFVSNSTITVKSLFRDYDVSLHANIADEIEKLKAKSNVHIIIDSKVYELYKDRMTWIEDIPSLIKIEAVEKYKDIKTVQNITQTLLENGVTKNDGLIVIGGGIIQDVSAFTANILKRGINWYFLPTTLLAMCDSCIGSKVGINMSGFKNQIGLFWPPTKIFIDIKFLDTLEKNEILSGIGEILKVHLIAGEDDFDKVERDYSILTSDFSILKQYILRSLEIKKGIVEADELDVDYRHILNYGHTFGHAIEAYTNHLIPHGIGVSIGMEIANYISMKKGYISENLFNRISKVLKQNIPYNILNYSEHEKMSKILSQDKKFDGKKLSVILCKGIGNIVKEKVIINESLLGLIDDYTKYYNAFSLNDEE